MNRSDPCRAETIVGKHYNVFTRLLPVVLVLLVFSLVLVQASHAKGIAIFVDGWGDCCASKMTIAKAAFKEMGIEVHVSPWNTLSIVSGKTKDTQVSRAPTSSTEKFISQMNQYFSTLPPGTEVYLIGHSFGADSILRFLEQYKGTNVKIMLVAVLDPVTFGALRTSQYGVGKNVEYFFNRWQTNAPWPLNFNTSSRVPCSAKTCDQKEQNISRNPKGEPIMTECSPLEMCPGTKLAWDGTSPNIKLGFKESRIHHDDVPTDLYVQEQICEIVRKQRAAASSAK